MTQTNLQSGPVLDMKNCAGKREEWLAQLAANASVNLDLENLQAIDTAGVQLLISLERECSRMGVSLTLASENPVASEAFALLGITNWRP